MKKLIYKINNFLSKIIDKFKEKEQRHDFVGKRKIDYFRRNIIRYKNINDVITQTIHFLKDFLLTDDVSFYYWNEEIGHFVDFLDIDKTDKIQIFDPLIIILSEYDLIFLKRNIDFIRNEEHKKVILNFLEKKNANILIPLILNESILGFIYANSPKYIVISDYFILEELRYFVIITLSNSMTYTRLEFLLKNLEEKVLERTNELQKAQKSLIQQEKMATLGTMISGIAHEFNTPVGVIQVSSSQILKYFEHLIEIFFTKKDFRSLPDEFLDVLRYYVYHLVTSSLVVTTKSYKLKKQLKEYFDENQIYYDEDLIQFLIQFRLYQGDNSIFNNKTNLINRILKLYAKSDTENRKLILEIMQYLNLIYENLERILHSSKSITKLVQLLRGYSRSSKNEMLIYNVVQIIENTLDMLQNTLKNKVKIIKDFQYNDSIVCDSNQIQQVLINIIINAYHALRDANIQNPTIIIKTKEINSEYIEIQIHDNGPGIPEEIQQQVWDPFFTTKPQKEGTGLGLGIVKNIVEGHNGKVFFESSNKGTIFFVQLPKKQVEQNKTIHPAIKYGRYDWR